MLQGKLEKEKAYWTDKTFEAKPIEATKCFLGRIVFVPIPSLIDRFLR